MTDTTRKEADMGYVKDFVSLIAQALVDATELPAKIAAIQSSMDGLNADLERTKARNIELDTLLGDTRRQRDEAEQALSQAKAQVTSITGEHDYLDRELKVANSNLAQLRDQLKQAQQERDDYGLKQMEAEDRATQAEAKLAKLAEALGLPKAQPIPLVVGEPPKPPTTPYPSPVMPVEANPTQFGQAQVGSSPIETVVPKRVYEGEPGFNELSHFTEKYDPDKMTYYRTA